MIENDDNKELVADLKKHSALTSYKSIAGKKLPLSVYKATQAIYSKEQKILKDAYRKNAIDIISDIFPKDKVDLILDDLYSNKEINFKSAKINELSLIDFSIKVFQEKIKSTNWNMLDYNTLKQKISLLNDSILTKIAVSNIDRNCIEYKEFKEANIKMLSYSKKAVSNIQEEVFDIAYTNGALNEILVEIKQYAKDITIKKSVGAQQIDYSSLARMVGVNTTRLKKELKESVSNFFEFNYINKKNLDIDIKAAMLASVKFTTGSGITSLEYQIPEEILKLLLLPDVFSDMKSKITFKFESTYSYDLYQFLKDNLYKGKVDVDKEELFEFLNVPTKAREYRYYLEQKILAPTIAELELISDISVTYQFVPEKRWRKIQFFIRKNENYKDEVIEIRKLKEELKKYEDNERIVKAVEKVKRNIYVARAWNKHIDNKVNRMYNEYGEDFCVLILNELYSSLNDNIKTTLIQYVNGIIKNLKEEARKDKKRLTKKMLNETLTEKIDTINEDVIPNIESETDFVLFLNNIPKISNYKTEINHNEFFKLNSDLTRLGKSREFIDGLVDKYFIIKK